MIAKFLDDNKPKTWTVSNFIDLIQFHLICQMLAKFSEVEFERTVSKFWKRKRKFLCCVHLLYKAGVVMHLQSCCFSDLNLQFFVCLFVFFSWHMGDRVAVAEELFWNCGLGVTVPLVVTSKPRFQNAYSATANLFPILLIPIETLRYESDCLRKAPKAYLIHKAKTIYPLQMNKLEEQ